MDEKTSEIRTKMMTRAEALVDAMARREYRNAPAHFDITMITLMPAENVEELWSQIVGSVGAFQERLGSRLETIHGRPIVTVLGKFEKANLAINVTFDANANISGLHFAAIAPTVGDVDQAST